MATVDMNHVQFWPSRSNSILKQRPASSHSTSKSLYTKQPAPLRNKADRAFKRNGQSTLAIAAVQHQGDDSAAGAQGCDNDPSNRDDETDDDFPPIEDLLSQISREGISTRGCRNLEDTLQHVPEPILDTSGSHPSPASSRLDDGIGGSQGTRDRPVVLEDDESDIPNPKATAEPSKQIDQSSHGLRCDIEDGGHVDDDPRPLPPLEQEGLASTPMLAQDQPHSLHHSPILSPDQTNQLGNDGTTRGALNEPAPYSLPNPLGWSSGVEKEKTVSELETDSLPAFEEQEKSSIITPSSPRPHRSAEPSHLQVDQEHDQSGTGNARLEELRHGSPLRSRGQKEEPQEQRQRQEVAVEMMREEEDDGDNEEQEPQGEKRQRQGNEETSCDSHPPKGSDSSHNTSDEADEDPLPAKRRKLPPTPTDSALAPPDKPTPVDNDQHHTPQTSRSPSITVESAQVAEYQEWPFQGFLKRTKIGNETTYNLEFQLSYAPEHLHLPVLSEALGIRSNKEMSAPHGGSAHSKMYSAAVRPQIKRVRWAPEEDATILKMREEDGCSWEEIHAALPHRTRDAIQVHFSTKLKK